MRSFGKIEQFSRCLDAQKETNVLHLAFFVDNGEGRRTASCSKCSSVAERLETGVIRGREVLSLFLSGRYLLNDMSLAIAMIVWTRAHAVL